MTALSQYERLEAAAVWHSGPYGSPREVVVTLGDATLTIVDFVDTPLGHWSLPAVERVWTRSGIARYRPGPQATESLEIDDDAMIAAIAQIHDAISPPQSRRFRTAWRSAATGIAARVGAMLW